MADLNYKQNDIPPYTLHQLLYADQTIADLSTAQGIKFIFKLKTSTGAATIRTATLVDGPTGKVSYTWQTNDLNTAGTYIAEWQVTYTNGNVLTFPSNDYITINVAKELGS